MLRMVQTGELVSVTGKTIRMEAGSICLHGDSPGAVAMARRVRERLAQAGVELRAFVD
jgi:UPF0271 protein